MRWLETINIKPILNDENIEPDEAARQISALLLKSVYKDIVLESLCEELVVRSEEGEEEFDNVLSNIYNWADYHKVWLGL
jgi:hypothetical protein